jgi:hypothetical protein
MPVLLAPEQRWVCPNCTATDVTREAAPHSRFHACRGLRGLTAPMVPAGTRCKVEALEREDYVGRERVTTDGEGRPVMAVETTRDDGTDRAVFAPCAVAGREDIA